MITVSGLHKSYGPVEAVRGIDLEVHAGEVFAFLGPNGAGKTTTVEILEGYRDRDGGEVSVFGVDPAHPHPRVARAHRDRAAERQARVVPDRARDCSTSTRAGTRRRAGGRDDRAGRPDRAAPTGGWASSRAASSGGLDVALALIGDPDLLFLDEPTTGFDP